MTELSWFLLVIVVLALGIGVGALLWARRGASP